MLDGPQMEPKAEAKRLVVLLHGYGSNGEDLIGLVPFFAQADPHAVFVSPNAPQHSHFSSGAYQWFPIPYIDGSTAEAMAKGLLKAQKQLDDYIKAKLVEFNLGVKDVVIIGFSQGTMMALECALTFPEAIAGVIGFSGSLLAIDDIEARMTAKPPIALIHGEDDDVVAVDQSIAAYEKLSALGVDIVLHKSPDTPHGIAQDGLDYAVEFYEKTVLQQPIANSASQ